MMRSTSPMSRPSSPMDVATSVLYSPFLNFCTISSCTFCGMPSLFLPAACPTKTCGFTIGLSLHNTLTMSSAESLKCAKIMILVASPASMKWFNTISLKRESFGCPTKSGSAFHMRSRVIIFSKSGCSQICLRYFDLLPLSCSLLKLWR